MPLSSIQVERGLCPTRIGKVGLRTAVRRIIAVAFCYLAHTAVTFIPIIDLCIFHLDFIETSQRAVINFDEGKALGTMILSTNPNAPNWSSCPSRYRCRNSPRRQ